MIDGLIMQKLMPITDEEHRLLNSDGNFDRDMYMSSDRNVINSEKMLEEGKLITIRSHPRFIDFPPHSHDFIEVAYVCSGSAVHIVNGTRVELKEGELLFLNPHAVEEILKVEETDISVNFIILPQFFDKALDMLGEEETPLKSFIIDSMSGMPSGSDYLHFKVADVLPVQNLIENLIYTLVFDIPNNRQINQTTMGLLIIQLLNHTDLLSVEDKTDALLVEVFRYIEENYSRGALGELAKKLHCDLYWLSREIKRKTGSNYTELLQKKRLSQAEFLLRTTKINIADIAIEVGYDNVSYFYRIFSKHTGMSPREYRKCK